MIRRFSVAAPPSWRIMFAGQTHLAVSVSKPDSNAPAPDPPGTGLPRAPVPLPGAFGGILSALAGRTGRGFHSRRLYRPQHFGGGALVDVGRTEGDAGRRIRLRSPALAEIAAHPAAPRIDDLEFAGAMSASQQASWQRATASLIFGSLAAIAFIFLPSDIAPNGS